MGKDNRQYGGEPRTPGICSKCGKSYDDYQMQHRKYICKECFNARSKEVSRKVASTLDGYFSLILNGIKNNPMRKRYHNDVDLEYLMNLYELQNGCCAISNIRMTWGYEDGDDEFNKRFRKPYNISVDRINPSKGYTKDNIVLVCNLINFFKGNNDIGVVFSTAKEIVDNDGRFEMIIKSIRENLLAV